MQRLAHCPIKLEFADRGALRFRATFYRTLPLSATKANMASETAYQDLQNEEIEVIIQHHNHILIIL